MKGEGIVSTSLGPSVLEQVEVGLKPKESGDGSNGLKKVSVKS